MPCVRQRRSHIPTHLEREELGFLSRAKVAQVGVVDDLETGGELVRLLVVTLGLLAQLEERLLDLDVRQGVDLGERGDADVREMVLPRDVSESVDDPGGLVIAAVSVRGLTAGRRRGRIGLRDAQVDAVDGREDVLTPGDEIGPDVDVVPFVR